MWIDYRLPKDYDLNEYGEVLVTTADHFIKVAVWTGSEFVMSRGWCESSEVLAWQPLPPVYRKDKDE